MRKLYANLLLKIWRCQINLSIKSMQITRLNFNRGIININESHNEDVDHCIMLMAKSILNNDEKRICDFYRLICCCSGPEYDSRSLWENTYDSIDVIISIIQKIKPVNIKHDLICSIDNEVNVKSRHFIGFILSLLSKKNEIFYEQTRNNIKKLIIQNNNDDNDDDNSDNINIHNNNNNNNDNGNDNDDFDTQTSYIDFEKILKTINENRESYIHPLTFSCDVAFKLTDDSYNTTLGICVFEGRDYGYCSYLLDKNDKNETLVKKIQEFIEEKMFKTIDNLLKNIFNDCKKLKSTIRSDFNKQIYEQNHVKKIINFWCNSVKIVQESSLDNIEGSLKIKRNYHSKKNNIVSLLLLDNKSCYKLNGKIKKNDLNYTRYFHVQYKLRFY